LRAKRAAQPGQPGFDPPGDRSALERPSVRRLIVAAIATELDRKPAARWTISAARTLIAADLAKLAGPARHEAECRCEPLAGADQARI